MFRKPLCRTMRLASVGGWLVLVVALAQLIALPVGALAWLDALNSELCGKRLVAPPSRDLPGSGAEHKRASSGSINWREQQRGWNRTIRDDYGDYNDDDDDDNNEDWNRDERTAAGYQTYEGEFPWFVEIETKFHSMPGFTGLCSAVIIHRNLVLTVAHCLEPKTGVLPYEVRALAGGRQVKTGRRSMVDPHFAGDDPNNSGHDLGLVKLEQPLEYDEFVQPACLQPESRAPPASKESGCVLASKGNTDGDIESSGELLAMPLQRCPANYPERPDETCYVSADTTKKHPGGACFGDSGAPLMCSDGNPAQGSAARFFAVGLVSSGPTGRCQSRHTKEIHFTDLRKQRASLLAMAQNLHDEQLRGRWRNSSRPLWWGRGSH